MLEQEKLCRDQNIFGSLVVSKCYLSIDQCIKYHLNYAERLRVTEKLNEITLDPEDFTQTFYSDLKNMI